MRILLVDDDPIFTEMLTASLTTRASCETTVVHSAAEALAVVDEQRVPFDCFLLDIMMENTDGVELCRLLRQRKDCRSAPIIMITTGSPDLYMERAYEAGATDYLRKPLDLVQMVGRIKTAMMLVEATKREKRGRWALRTLISYSSEFNLIDLNERISFSEVDGMVDFYQMENRLLRLEQGLYPITLLRVQIRNFSDLYSSANRGYVLQHLHAISSIISDEIVVKPFQMAYIGYGTFLICVDEKNSIVPQSFQGQLNNKVSRAIWDAPAEGIEDVILDVTALSSNQLQSRDAVLETLTKEINRIKRRGVSYLPKIDDIEDYIFSRIKEEEEKQFSDH
ncbi:response regulator [Marivita sp.]|uniref:response regulator n=1 Tax=Marivita sp. TaxID=2003365 RepID=UPI003F6FF28E